MSSVIDVTITYLEQCQPVAPKAHAPLGQKLAILRVDEPPVHFYRYLYDLIGGPYNWVSRRDLSNDVLAQLIQHEDVYLYVLYCGGAPAGMAEIDAREHDVAEIKFFGLAPDFVGRGLGRYYLSNIIELAWQLNPERVILETCTLDHPAALPLYQKLGFSVFDQKQGRVKMIEPEV